MKRRQREREKRMKLCVQGRTENEECTGEKTDMRNRSLDKNEMAWRQITCDNGVHVISRRVSNTLVVMRQLRLCHPTRKTEAVPIKYSLS